MNEQITPVEAKELDRQIAKIQKAKVVYRQVLALKPPKTVVRTHPFGKFDYLPITAVERLLDGLFSSWTATIKDTGVAVNGFYVVVNLKAQIPNSDEYLESDGIGFAEFQTTKGAASTDFTKLSQAAGVIAVPRARAEAIKNAAKSFGNIFGRNLSRKDDQQEDEHGFVNTSRQKIINSLKD